MASLRDMVSEYQDDLRNGIAWLAFWREGRSWQAEAFHLDLDDTLYPEDRARLAEIQAADPQAVVVNGYYSGYLSEEMSVAELAAGVRHHYDNGLNNIAPFIEAHSDELPPDVLEAAREKAHAAGLPFYERPYRGDDIDPYGLHIRDELVAGAFASLPEPEQQILILHCVAAMADGEIGGLVGMSKSAVQRHRTKTLKELRQRLEDDGGRKQT